MNLFASEVKRLREQKNLTKEQLADLLGVKKLTIENYENGLYSPPIGKLGKLAEVLGCEYDYLYDILKS